MVAHGYLAVAAYGHFAQAVALAPPAGQPHQLVHIDALFSGVAGEGVVYAQGGVAEVALEILGGTGHGSAKGQKEGKQMDWFIQSLHDFVGFRGG